MTWLVLQVIEDEVLPRWMPLIGKNYLLAITSGPIVWKMTQLVFKRWNTRSFLANSFYENEARSRGPASWERGNLPDTSDADQTKLTKTMKGPCGGHPSDHWSRPISLGHVGLISQSMTSQRAKDLLPGTPGSFPGHTHKTRGPNPYKEWSQAVVG